MRAGLEAAFDSVVTRVDHSRRRIRLETTRGTIAADAAIVTLPSAVIAANEDLFAPALPAKTRAAAGLPLGHDDKLFLSLAEAEAFAPDTRVFGKLTTAATGGYQFRPLGRPMIECYFGGDLAAELEAGGEAAFFDYARGELVGLYGGDFARRIAPLAVHGWGVDPFARGAYSYALPGRADDRAALAAPDRRPPVLCRRSLLARRLFDRPRRLPDRPRRRGAGDRRARPPAQPGLTPRRPGACAFALLTLT